MAQLAAWANNTLFFPSLPWNCDNCPAPRRLELKEGEENCLFGMTRLCLDV